MKSIVVIAGMLFAGAAAAQTAHQPYAGEQRRAVKSLSERDTADLLEARGMGLAKAAELNGYPGPMHVLEHAGALQLSEAQRAAMVAIRGRMAAAARALGAEIVARETELDAAFAGGTVDSATMQAKTGEIAALSGRLRAVHLAAHLETRPLLSAVQLAQYRKLRGYDDAGPEQPRPHRHH